MPPIKSQTLDKLRKLIIPESLLDNLKQRELMRDLLNDYGREGISEKELIIRSI